MSDSSNDTKPPDTSTNDELRAGQVVEFVKLHLDTATCHNRFQEPLVFNVNGKQRPMLVLRRCSEMERGKKLYLVLPITSKGVDKRGKVRPGHVRLGNVIDKNKPSFVDCFVRRIPDNLVWRRRGKPVVRDVCDRMVFGYIIKCLTQDGLGQPTERIRDSIKKAICGC